MNYRIRLVKQPASTMEYFFENSPQDWNRLRELLSFGYVVVQVEPIHR